MFARESIFIVTIFVLYFLIVDFVVVDFYFYFYASVVVALNVPV